jgi:hypothetical protein
MVLLAASGASLIMTSDNRDDDGPGATCCRDGGARRLDTPRLESVTSIHNCCEFRWSAQHLVECL